MAALREGRLMLSPRPRNRFLSILGRIVLWVALVSGSVGLALFLVGKW